MMPYLVGRARFSGESILIKCLDSLSLHKTLNRPGSEHQHCHTCHAPHFGGLSDHIEPPDKSLDCSWQGLGGQDFIGGAFYCPFGPRKPKFCLPSLES